MQREKRDMEALKQKDYEYIIKQDRQLECYKEAHDKAHNKQKGKKPLTLIHKDMKCEVAKYQEMLESREALISATGFALDHVIE